MRWIVCLFSLKPIRMLWVCAGAFSCISSTLPQFWNTHIGAHKNTHARTHAHFYIEAHKRAHMKTHNLFSLLLLFNSSFSRAGIRFCVWNILTGNCKHAYTIQESHKLVFYTEEEVFFRDRCAVQLLSNPASTDAVVVIRRLCAKAHLKE